MKAIEAIRMHDNDELLRAARKAAVKLIPREIQYSRDPNDGGDDRLRMSADVVGDFHLMGHSLMGAQLELSEYQFPQKAIVRCAHCNGWAAAFTSCVHCGAPVPA